MGKPLVGEIVVLPFPQTILPSGKRRPALFVADLPGDDPDSFIRSNRLLTVEQSVILYTVGKIKGAKLHDVKAKVRQLFA
jgi:hypothetical protein